jgi:predicted ATPase
MNLLAGRKALASTAYPAALRYLTTGIKLLTADSWVQEYDLSLALYETAAEAAYLAGEFEQMEGFVEVVLAQAKTLLEKVKVYEVKIQAYGAQNKALEAVNIALTFLKLLGVEFPDNPSQLDIQLAMAEVELNLKERCFEDLIDMPEMIEAKALAVMSILSSVAALTYQVLPELFPLIVLKQITQSLQSGNSSLSPFAYVSYGLILCGIFGNIESGYKFGNLAVSLVDKLNTKKVAAKTMLGFYTGISHYNRHIKEVLKPLLEAYHIGCETGDLEFAAYSINAYFYSSYFVSKELTELELEMAKYGNTIRQINQETVLGWSAIYRQSVLNLRGAVENPCTLIGELYNEKNMLPIHLKAKDKMGIFYLYVSKLHLCYLFQEFHQADENSVLAENYLDGGIGQIVFPIFNFYNSLTRLAIYIDVPENERLLILNKVIANQEKMQHWAQYAPMNYLDFGQKVLVRVLTS